MSTEGLQKVKEAESEAERLVDAAVEEADRLLDDAELEASRRVAVAESRARHESDELRRRLEGETEAEIQTINEDAERQRHEIRDGGLARMDEAVKAVLEGIQP